MLEPCAAALAKCWWNHWLLSTRTFALSCLPAKSFGVRMHCGGKSHSRLTADPISLNNGKFQRQWKTQTVPAENPPCTKSLNEKLTLKTKIHTKCKIKHNSVVERRKWLNFSWWHQLLGIIVMLSSIGYRGWMWHEEVIEGDRHHNRKAFHCQRELVAWKMFLVYLESLLSQMNWREKHISPEENKVIQVINWYNDVWYCKQNSRLPADK